MLKALKTFKRGGVHPPEGKELSKDAAIESFMPQKSVVIPIQQNIGAPPKVIVKKRQVVKAGEVIAEPGGAVSVPVHASVSGKVKAIEKYQTSAGYALCVEITLDKEQVKIDEILDEPLNSVDLDNKNLLLEKIKNAGLVGMGGAQFPTHIKLSPPPQAKIDTLILNGAECEPYLTADHRLMLEHTEEIIRGGEIFMHILGLKKFFIGIENNKEDAISKFLELEKKYGFFEVVPLKTKYPQGAEKQLIKVITGREVPSKKLPFHVGCVVQNVGTSFAAYEAVYKNKPLIERVLTLSGDGITKPSNVRAPIGTKLDDLIQFCDGMKDGVKRIIAGGPMMGKAIKSTDIPVTKGTSGILFFTDDSPIVEELDCIRCGMCLDVCPQGLVPCDLATFSEYEKFEFLEDLQDCVECGSCAYTCPAHRRLVQWIRYGKLQYRNFMASKK